MRLVQVAEMRLVLVAEMRLVGQQRCPPGLQYRYVAATVVLHMVRTWQERRLGRLMQPPSRVRPILHYIAVIIIVYCTNR